MGAMNILIYNNGFSDHQQVGWEKLQGTIRNPFAFYFSIQRGFSGSIQTLPFALWIMRNLCLNGYAKNPLNWQPNDSIYG